MRFRCDAGKVYNFSFNGDVRDIIEDALNKAIVTPRASDVNKEGRFFQSGAETSDRKTSAAPTNKPPAQQAKEHVIHEEDNTIGELIDFSKYQLNIGSEETDSELDSRSGLDDNNDHYEDDYAYSQKFL